jgi:hypothetical protein
MVARNSALPENANSRTIVKVDVTMDPFPDNRRQDGSRMFR